MIILFYLFESLILYRWIKIVNLHWNFFFITYYVGFGVFYFFTAAKDFEPTFLDDFKRQAHAYETNAKDDSTRISHDYERFVVDLFIILHCSKSWLC